MSDGVHGCGEPYNNDDAFYSGGWQTNGWRNNWLTPVVNHYKNDSAIAWYEWANEPQITGDGTLMLNFFNNVGSYVRGALGDTHLIGTGTMSAYGNDSAYRKAFSSSQIDLCSQHEYDYTQTPSNWTARDYANAQSVNKPFYVGESGIPKSYSNRATLIRDKILGLKNNYPNCVSFLYWSGSSAGGAGIGYEIPLLDSPEINILNTTSLL